jgi:hypothetical protein
MLNNVKWDGKMLTTVGGQGFRSECSSTFQGSSAISRWIQVRCGMDAEFHNTFIHNDHGGSFNQGSQLKSINR